MADKNTRFVLSIFGMLIAAGLILLATVLVSQAQDFEPDRRPEKGLAYALTFSDGSARSVGYKTTTATVVGTTPQVVDRVVLSSGIGAYYYAHDASLLVRPLSVSMWYCATYQATSVNQRLAQWGHYSAVERGVFILFHEGYGANPYHFTSAVYVGGALRYASSATQRTLGNWYHLAIVDDGATVTLYIDGEVAGTGSAPSGTLGDGNVSRFRIGCGANAAASGEYEFTRGPWADFRYYAGTALSNAEVRTIYQQGHP